MHMGMFSDDVKNKKIDRKTLRRAWGFAGPYRRQLTGYLVTIVIVSVFGVVPPLVTRKIIDSAIPSRDRGSITAWVAVLVVVALLSSALGGITRWLSSVLGEGVIASTRKALYDHVQQMPISFFTRVQTGSLMSRLNNDVVGAQSAFTFVLRSALSNVLTVSVTLAAMLTLSWKFTLALLLVVPFLVWLSKRVGRVQEKAAREAMGRNAAMNSVMTERFNVSGALLVKLFGRPDEERAAFASSADKVAAIGVRRAVTGMVFDLTLGLVGTLLTASIYWWGANQVLDGKITVGTLVAMSILAQRVYGPLTDLASARIEFVTAFVSFERIFEVLDAPRSIVEKLNARSLPPSLGKGAAVEFDDVWFRYPAASEVSVASLESGGAPLSSEESAWVLQGLTAVCAPGTLTAIVGPSGAGKTTVSSLVPRLYDVTRGGVRIDGVDVRDLTSTSIRDAVGVVSQDAHLFHDTIASNLRYAKPSATDAELVEVCRAARIHDLIAGLPDGYATMVGERGYRLSGGEKQRMALARVLLKNPRVVILDEATAHLDSETEVHIQEALSEALVGRTSIVIAHRLSTIRDADQILVIDGGRIVERGTHDELVGNGGLYAHLTETQFLGALPTA
jgi:ATP-binding cassette, subfamily B, bacterial